MSQSSPKSTRRQFLRSAGGVTFLALSPVGRGLFAAPTPPKSTAPLLFTALPYIQPGAGSALIENRETCIVAWQTEQKPATFELRFSSDKSQGRSARIERTSRGESNNEDDEGRFNYAATLDGLKLGTRYSYRLVCDGALIMEGYFTTRQPRGKAIRFVAFGDNSFGDISDRAIAYQAYRANPDFVMNTGDNVYDGGLDNEYARYFFPVYNAPQAGPRVGAPLLRSVPFYTVIANHDVHRKANGGPVADFDKDPDALAYYTNMHLPLNGPLQPAQPTPAVGKDAIVNSFKQCAGARYPRMANYSFDWGDAHFCCLDANVYIDPTDAALQAWIERDLTSTDATWKFVVYHHPAFNVGEEHYTEQHMRVLSPLFERCGVVMCLHGHEHNYQRTRPMTFAPRDTARAKDINSLNRLVPGTFTIDRAFDGRHATKPQGIIYITTGAGGKHLYDRDQHQNPPKWTHAEDDHADYIARFISDRHSLTVFELDSESFLMRQIDEAGEEIERIRVTKV